MFRLFKRRKKWHKLKINDVIIEYDGITVLEYEVYRIDPVVGVAIARGVWEGQTYEKAFCYLYQDPRVIFSTDYDFKEDNPDPSRRYLIQRR